jgi:hypothetical protein
VMIAVWFSVSSWKISFRDRLLKSFGSSRFI